VAIAGRDGELREHSLLVGGHFDQARIYKSAIESGATLIWLSRNPGSRNPALLRAREIHSTMSVGLRSSTLMFWSSVRSQPCNGNLTGIRIAARLTHHYLTDWLACEVRTKPGHCSLRPPATTRLGEYFRLLIPS
jgi:hypothetical protein